MNKLRSIVLASCVVLLGAVSAFAAPPRNWYFRDHGYHPPASAFRPSTHSWTYYDPYTGLSGYGFNGPASSFQYGIAPQQSMFITPVPVYGGYGGYGTGYGGAYGFGGYGGFGGGW